MPDLQYTFASLLAMEGVELMSIRPRSSSCPSATPGRASSARRRSMLWWPRCRSICKTPRASPARAAGAAARWPRSLGRGRQHRQGVTSDPFDSLSSGPGGFRGRGTRQTAARGDGSVIGSLPTGPNQCHRPYQAARAFVAFTDTGGHRSQPEMTVNPEVAGSSPVEPAISIACLLNSPSARAARAVVGRPVAQPRGYGGIDLGRTGMVTASTAVERRAPRTQRSDGTAVDLIGSRMTGPMRVECRRHRGSCALARRGSSGAHPRPARYLHGASSFVGHSRLTAGSSVSYEGRTRRDKTGATGYLERPRSSVVMPSRSSSAVTWARVSATCLTAASGSPPDGPRFLDARAATKLVAAARTLSVFGSGCSRSPRFARQ